MSDDEEEGVLRIDESPDEDETPTISVAPAKVSTQKKEPEKEVRIEKLVKEEGELDEEEEEVMDATEKDKPTDSVESTESTKKEVKKEVKIEENEPKEVPEVIPEKKNGNGSMKPPQSVEKTPASHRKRKESAENFGDKRKSGLETIASSSSGSSTPQRSKRASSHMANLAISACFNEEDIVGVPMMPIQRTPTETTSVSKRAKLSNAAAREKDTSGETSDASTNVITTKSADTSDLQTKESLMETAPGSQILLEVTVMYRTRTSLAFKVKGCELVGFMGDGLPPMAHAAISSASTGQPGTSNNKNKKEDNKDGYFRRSGSTGPNGRNVRGGSVAREGGGGGKNEKGKKDAKRKKEEEKEVEEPDDESGEQQALSQKCDLVEVDLTEYHDCHHDGCEKRFRLSTELEYHITKTHRKRVLMYESMCSQTEPTPEFRDASTEIDEDLMPILKKESPIKTTSAGGHVYEDLSDDDQPADLLKSVGAPSASSAAAALMGIAQASSSSSMPSKIAMNPAAMMAVVQQNEKNKQQQQQQKSVFVTHSPMPHQPSSSTPSQVQPPPQALLQAGPHPLQQFLPPGFHPSLMHHPQMALLDPRMAGMAAVVSQQQQQQMAASRTPSRQISASDSHKIHELAKAKDAAEQQQQQRQRQQGVAGGPSGNTPKPPGSGIGTPQRLVLPPHLMPQSAGTPQSVQQQQSQQHQQQTAHIMQQIQMAQLAQRSMLPPPQDPMMALIMSMNQYPMGQSAVFPGAQPQQQPPPNAPK